MLKDLNTHHMSRLARPVFEEVVDAVKEWLQRLCLDDSAESSDEEHDDLEAAAKRKVTALERMLACKLSVDKEKKKVAQPAKAAHCGRKARRLPEGARDWRTLWFAFLVEGPCRSLPADQFACQKVAGYSSIVHTVRGGSAQRLVMLQRSGAAAWRLRTSTCWSSWTKTGHWSRPPLHHLPLCRTQLRPRMDSLPFP